jgi:hypothetical protein
MVESMFARPNLKENNIDTLEFLTKSELGTELNNLIKEKGTPLGQAYVFGESYTIARVKHTFTIQFVFSRKFSTESRKTVLETQATFRFLLTPGVKVPKEVSSPNDIIESLNKMETINSFRCSLTYDYKKQDKRKFILALPIKISESPIFPFETIDGIGIRGKIENMDYSGLVATMPIRKNTHLLIMFEKNYHFNSHIVEKIMNDSNMIANKLMLSSGG